MCCPPKKGSKGNVGPVWGVLPPPKMLYRGLWGVLYPPPPRDLCV